MGNKLDERKRRQERTEHAKFLSLFTGLNLITRAKNDHQFICFLLFSVWLSAFYFILLMFCHYRLGDAESVLSYKISAKPYSWINPSGGFFFHHYVLPKVCKYRTDVLVRSQAMEASSSGASDSVNQSPGMLILFVFVLVGSLVEYIFLHSVDLCN